MCRYYSVSPSEELSMANDIISEFSKARIRCKDHNEEKHRCFVKWMTCQTYEKGSSCKKCIFEFQDMIRARIRIELETRTSGNSEIKGVLV